MPTLTTGQLEVWMAQAFWPFVRIGACFMLAPSFGAPVVPPRTRLVLAGAVALLVIPLVHVPDNITPLSPAGFVITAQQVLIGASIGFALQVVFDAVSLGGQLLANSMGLSFAFNVDPVRGASTPVVGQLYALLVMLTFLALNGHLTMIEVLVDGFRTMPVSTEGFGSDGLWQIALWGTQIFSGALAVALPGVTALMIVNLAFGVMSRAAPTLNLFAVGFPITLALGLVIVLVGLPTLQTNFTELMTGAFSLIRELLGPAS
jgi:flagellar biosynthetic protein FliR